MLDLEILIYEQYCLWKAWVCVCCWAELKVTEYSYSQFDAFLDQWISFSTSRGSLVKTQNCQSCFDWLVLKSKQKIFDDYWEQLTLRSFQIFFVFWRVWKFWTLEQGISHSTDFTAASEVTKEAKDSWLRGFINTAKVTIAYS